MSNTDYNSIYIAQVNQEERQTDTSNQIDQGSLQVQVVEQGTQMPVRNAQIEISDTGNPDQILEVLNTDENGFTENISLKAPPLEYSMTPSDNQPYAEYNIKVSASTYEQEIVSGVQIFSGERGNQNIRLTPQTLPEDVYNPISIGPHTLWGNYPPKIAEEEIKPVNATGEIVLSRVVIPEYIVVHDGSPSDSSASDYYILYRDYIKNVASCEIYSTWPQATLEANILAIMSFTLNRVYTEWYRNKGYNFTITSSTAFDHKWIYNKTTYDSISSVVDRIFNQYLSRPNVSQPILTQYCDGKRVTCPNWMSQWGSKYLGDDGYTAIDILRNYYGSSIYVNTADAISGIPSSYPGYELSIGSSGDKVRQLQEQLNRIAKDYSAIPTITVDGIYGSRTADAVRTFQRIFNLPQTGTVGFTTWYKISEIYVGVSRIAELN